MNTLKKYFTVRLICRLVSAIIIGQTLYFKFTAHPDSVYIFTRLGMEPWGRYVIGLFELFAIITMLFKRTSWLGSFIAVTLMFGAIFSHLTLLGVNVQGDQGELFTLAVVVFICSLINLFLERSHIPVVGLLFVAHNEQK